MPAAFAFPAMIVAPSSPAHPPVTLTEIDGLARQAFRAADRDGDDHIRMEELRSGWGAPRGGKAWGIDIVGPPEWLRADRDGDGRVSSHEIAERYRARLEDLDREGDGVLTHEEWRTGQQEEMITVCVTAPRCEQVEEIERARRLRVERNGRAFRRLDWPARSAYRFNSGIAKPLLTAVRDHRAWHALWDGIAARNGPRRAAPAVDFSREMLLVAAMGARPTGGYTIQIVSVRDTGRDLVVTAVRTSPGRRCGAAAATSEPADIVKVAATDKPIRWDVRDRATEC
jgi:hypothetical protein